MTIVELIKHEHDEVADLFDHLVVLARDRRRAEDITRTVNRLVALVRVHALAEERVVYEALRSQPPPLKAFALAAPHEHEVLDTTLDKLLIRRPEEVDFEVIVKVARDLFEMHARDEEESEILPIVQQLLPPAELAALARDMLAEEARIRRSVLRLVGIPASAA